MIFKPYFIYARLIPAIVCSVPFFVLYFFFLEPILGPFFIELIKLPWVGDISTITAFVLLLVLVGRSISKDIFEKRWFKSDETHMPTTDFLLHADNEYTTDFKGRVHTKIKAEFGIQVLSADEEIATENLARKTIAEAIALVRQKMKGGRLLLQHNIEYGFFRNLIGCAVIAAAISIINVLIFYWIAPNNAAMWLSVLLLVLYLLPILLSKMLMKAHGKRYARVLIQEYLSS